MCQVRSQRFESQHVCNFYTAVWFNRIYGMFIINNFCHDSTAPTGLGCRHFRDFTITLRHTIFDRTPLDEWSARRRDLYLTTHNNHKRLTSMTPAGLEPQIPTREWPQTHALHRAAPWIGLLLIYLFQTPFAYLSWVINHRYTTKNTSGLCAVAMLLFCRLIKVCASRSFMTEHFRT